MADTTHQTAPPPPAPSAPPETTIVVPRAQETVPETRDKDVKAAQEAKERMSKTQGFWNRLAPAKEGEPEKPVEAQPEKPPKKEETKEKREPSKKTEVVEEEPPKPETKPSRTKKGAEIDPMEIARATGQEIGREIAKAQNVPRGTTPEPVVELELPEEFRPDVAVFEEMARLEPKRYANIKKDLARYAKAESDYIAKWEKENEGQTYDGDADEHNAFYAKIRPDYDQKDFKMAERSLLKKELSAEVRKEVSEDLRTREVESERRRERAAQIQPEVEREMASTVSDMIREFEPENAEIKDWKTLEEKNPLLHDVVVAVHSENKPVMEATMRLFRRVEDVNPNNPVHVRIFDAIFNAEQEISRLPTKDRYDDEGRLFATQDDYAKMSPTDKSRHWYIGEREALGLIRGQAIARTKSVYERENQKQVRYSKRPNATETAHQTPPKTAETAPPIKPDNGSPSVSGRGTLPGDGQPASSGQKTGRDMLFSRLLGS